MCIPRPQYLFNQNHCILIKIPMRFPTKGRNSQIGFTDSGDGLAPNRHQAITWTNDQVKISEGIHYH